MSRVRRCLVALSAACLWLGVCQDANAQDWIDTLPQEIRDSILWHADVEEGDLYDWTYPDFEFSGGGIFNTGGAEVEVIGSQELAHSGSFSARATITNTTRAENGSRAIRLMRWTDRPWDDGGEYFPDQAYYSAWFYFPHSYNPNKYPPWDPGDGGWWNVFQFKSSDDQDQSQPIWVLNVDHDDDSSQMFFYLYTKYNTPASHGQANPLPIPVARWVHVEGYYQQSSSDQGRISIWQDGRLIFDLPDVRTILVGNAHWGIGNYTDHIAGGPVEGTASIYFDDAVVSTMRVSSAGTETDGGSADADGGGDAAPDGTGRLDGADDAGSDPGSDRGLDAGADPGAEGDGQDSSCACHSRSAAPGAVLWLVVVLLLLGLARPRS